MDVVEKGKKIRMEAREADPAVKEMRERLGQRIKSLRTSHGITQGQLAERVGMSQKYLGEVERGKRNVSLEAITVLAAALGVPASTILDNEHEQPVDMLHADIIRMVPKLALKDSQIVHRMVKLLAGE